MSFGKTPARKFLSDSPSGKAPGRFRKRPARRRSQAAAFLVYFPENLLQPSLVVAQAPVLYFVRLVDDLRGFARPPEEPHDLLPARLFHVTRLVDVYLSALFEVCRPAVEEAPICELVEVLRDPLPLVAETVRRVFDCSRPFLEDEVQVSITILGMS